MATFTGFFELRSPHTLLAKLRHDLDRLSDPQQYQWQQYAAFDFFVTAEHIVDWMDPDQVANDRDAHARQKAVRESHPLLRLVSQLASGGKHFEAFAKQHQSVAGTEVEGYADDYADDYFVEDLVVTLTPREATELGAPTLSIVEVAQRVIAYWTSQLQPIDDPAAIVHTSTIDAAVR
jgi:hypothetical protein